MRLALSGVRRKTSTCVRTISAFRLAALPLACVAQHISSSVFATGSVSSGVGHHHVVARGMAAVPSTMNAVLAQDGKCYVGQRPVPSLREKEVLVKIAYTAINRADTLQRTSKYPPPPGCTDILGLEATGTVAALGPGTSGRWALGSRVMALLPGGGNAEWVAVHEDHLLAVPEGMPWATAAAIPETWLTAYQLLFMVGQLRAGETVLIHAAGSGVGTAATQLAASAGATVIAVAGADSKLEVAKSLGASATVNYKTTPAFSAAVLEATGGRGADLVLDPVAASFWKENAAAIAQDGRWVLYGSMGGLNTEGNLLGMILRKRISLLGSTLRARSDGYKAELVARFAADALPRLASGALRPVVDEEYASLGHVQAAHEYMESNASTGKMVVRVDPPEA